MPIRWGITHKMRSSKNIFLFVRLLYDAVAYTCESTSKLESKSFYHFYQPFYHNYPYYYETLLN